MSDNECIDNNTDTGENEAVNIFNNSADKSNSTNSDEDYSRNKWNQHKKSRNQDNIGEGYEINDKGHRRRSMNHSVYSPKLDNNDDKKVLNLWNESGSDSEAECVPNGNKAIECFICGEQLAKIYKLRQHMQMHARAENYDHKRLERSVIYATLNPHQRNIETKVIRDFLVSEIQAKRYSKFYGILSEASSELHISDSETESDATLENDLQIPKNNYKCDMCQTNYNRRYKALFHQKAMHSNCNLYIECDYCGRQYIGIELLIHHMKTQCESDEKPITCVERFKQYLLKVNLEQFESLAQARKELKAQRMTTAQKIYTCDKCQKTFTRSEHLTRHRAVHLPEELKFECPVCFRRFNRKDNMRSHMKVHMDEAERDSSTNQPILCQYCGHCFTSKSNYVVHMRRHTGEKPYKCDVCGKGFPKSTDLNLHKITHSGEKKFVCSICNKAFARSAVLSKHMRIHAGPFHCNLCEQSFPRPNELAMHLRTHASGGRVCTCIVCNCNFYEQSQLEEHFVVSGHDNIRAPTQMLQEQKLKTIEMIGVMPEISMTQAPSINVDNDQGKENDNIVSMIQHTTATMQSAFSSRPTLHVPNAFLDANNTTLLQTNQLQNNIYGSWQS